MTKKTFLIFAFITLVFLVSACQSKKGNSNGSVQFLSGKLEHSAGETLYLEEMTPEGILLTDTVNVQSDGVFQFSKAKPHLGFYRIRITESNFLMLVLDTLQQVQITGDMRDLAHSAKIEGSSDSKLFHEMNDSSRISFAKRDSIMQVFQIFANQNKSDSLRIKKFADSMGKTYDSLAMRLNNYLVQLIQHHPTSLVSVLALQELAPRNSEENYLPQFFLVDSALSIKYPQAPALKTFLRMVMALKATQIGNQAPDFNLNTINGKSISLEKLKGQFLVIDFWASWCKPCREESPNMVRLYEKYHSKGLEIISISLDSDKDKWQAAIQKDHLNWIHVSELQGWKGQVAKQYNISQIPFTYLLDKSGKIMAKGLRAHELDAILARTIQVK